METGTSGFIAECFWPDVSEADLDALDRRVTAAAAEELDVRYLGSILLREDDVVLCQFDGPAESVRAVAERARVPFERILHATSTRRRER
jgi:uncharacterized protein YbjT (DUF2867 family)